MGEHHGLDFKAVSGMAAYFINDDLKITLGFAAQKQDNSFDSSINAFHSWTESQDYVIDFHAPLFPILAERQFGEKICSSKMFQRPVKQQCQSPKEFRKSGDFFHNPDPELSRQLTDIFTQHPLNMDIANICNDWYTNPIEKMKNSIKIKDQSGNASILKLTQSDIIGNW